MNKSIIDNLIQAKRHLDKARNNLNNIRFETGDDEVAIHLFILTTVYTNRAVFHIKMTLNELWGDKND